MIQGERLRGRTIGASSADWLTVDAHGLGTLDVRAMVETHDGAPILVQYRGWLDLSQGPGTAPVYAAPLFATGDERYRWLTRIQAVAKGTAGGDLLTYEVHEVR